MEWNHMKSYVILLCAVLAKDWVEWSKDKESFLSDIKSDLLNPFASKAWGIGQGSTDQEDYK